MTGGRCRLAARLLHRAGIFGMGIGGGVSLLENCAGNLVTGAVS